MVLKQEKGQPENKAEGAGSYGGEMYAHKEGLTTEEINQSISDANDQMGKIQESILKNEEAIRGLKSAETKQDDTITKLEDEIKDLQEKFKNVVSVEKKLKEKLEKA